MSVEIQFSTVYMHFAAHASNNHLIYEALREASIGYLGDKDPDVQELLKSLNVQYVDTEGFLRNRTERDGRFEVLMKDGCGSSESSQEELDTQSGVVAKASGFNFFELSDRCGERLFRFMSRKDRMQSFIESSFVMSKSLAFLSGH
ncbi:MAG: hypothetical protein SGBAC_002191 [Bacillariaceae sp.]